MNFGEVLSRAWSILWKYKVLWIFGLLASLSGGSGGNSFRNNFQSNGQPAPAPFNGAERFFENISPLVAVLLALAAVILIVALIILGTLGRAGLAKGAWLADGGEPRLTFSRLFEESRRYFGRVLILGILSFAFFIVLTLIIAIPSALAAALTLGIAMVCLLPLICLLIPVLYMLGVIFDLAVIAITGEDLGVMDGLRRAWEVVRANLGQAVALALILLIGSMVVNFVFALPALLFVGLFMAGFGLADAQVSNAAAVLGPVLLLIYLPVLLAARALVTTYVTSSWTVAFRRMTGRGAGAPDANIVEAQTAA